MMVSIDRTIEYIVIAIPANRRPFEKRRLIRFIQLSICCQHILVDGNICRQYSIDSCILRHTPLADILITIHYARKPVELTSICNLICGWQCNIFSLIIIIKCNFLL